MADSSAQAVRRGSAPCRVPQVVLFFVGTGHVPYRPEAPQPFLRLNGSRGSAATSESLNFPFGRTRIAIVTFVKVIRWTRHGHDRLYVKADDGVDLGWWDLKAGQAHPAPAGTDELLAVIAADWTARQDGPPQPKSPEPAQEVDPDFGPRTSSPRPAPSVPPPADVEVEWAPPTWRPIRDLAQTPPGANLYDHVAAARAAGERPTFLRKLFYGKNAYSSWERGLIGEQLVEAELRRLVMKDPRWGYLNSIPVGENGADIDHVIAGPGGVYTINAKYHRGANIWVGGNTLMVNGTRQPYIRNARYEASRASKLLARAYGAPVGVVGLVVPVDAKNFTVREQPEDVHVINRARLVAFLMRQPEILTNDQVYDVLSVARISTTWDTPDRHHVRTNRPSA